jgi:phage tail P2-like protein
MKPLSSAIENISHISIFDDVVKYRLDSIDLSVLLIYNINSCPEILLPILASQFNVKGVEGWKFVSTIDQKRELILNSGFVHKLKGTPYSMKRAMESIGFPGVYFQEGVGKYYDGSFNHDGSETHGSEGWAKYIAFVPVADPENVSAETTEIITKTLNEYAPVRCYLDSIVYI